MRLKKIGHKHYQGRLAGETWEVWPSAERRGKWTVWRGGGFYEKRQPTVQAAREFIARVWLQEKLSVLCDKIDAMPDGALRNEGISFLAWDTLLNDPATAMAFVDWCQDNGLFVYVRPIICEGGRAGLCWPAGWKGVAATMRPACKRGA